MKRRAWEATGRAEAIFFLSLKNNRQTRKNGHVAHRSEYSGLASLAAAMVRFPSAGNERYSKATLQGTRLITVPLFEGKSELLASQYFRLFNTGNTKIHFLKDKWRDNKIRQLVFSQGKGLLIDFYCV